MLILWPEGFLQAEKYSEISIIIFNFMINFSMTQLFKPDYTRKKHLTKPKFSVITEVHSIHYLNFVFYF